MRSLVVVALLLLLTSVAAQDVSHSSHGSHDPDETSHESHEGGHFEAAAVYDLAAGTGSFAAIPAAGTFQEETLAFMIFPAASADLDGLEEAGEAAEAAWDAYVIGAEPTVLAPGEEAVPEAAVVYQIALEDPLVLVPVDFATAGAYAVFLEHGTGEVMTALASASGAVLVPAAGEDGAAGGEEEEDEHGNEDESTRPTGFQWANALGASFVVSACSFAGLLVVINKQVSGSIGLSHAFIVASGALLTASLLHLIPEAMEGLKSKYEDSPHDLGLYAGLSVLGGMSFGVLIHALLDTGHSRGQHRLPQHAAGVIGADVLALSDSGHLMPRSLRQAKPVTTAARPPSYCLSKVMTLDVTQPPSPTEVVPDSLKELIAASVGRSLLDFKDLQPVCWNVVAGDLVHNFADGVTIGAAFLSCGTTIGWTVTASAILHEVPHELADFMALLNGGMSVKQLLPEALGVGDATSKRGRKAVICSQARKLASFLLGALLIGVPLIFDQHCEADGHEH